MSMIKFDLLLKRMWTVLAVLFCTVVSAHAAAITYQLTTHVDGRTITASANLNPGAALEDNMPQKLWRGYTTYKFYSNAELTREITTLPEDVSTVYVDYEFNPPFAMSEEGGTTVYYTLRGNYANGHDYYFYGTGTEVKAIINDYTQLSNPNQGKWAYYGDGYCLNFLNKATGTWLGYNNQQTKPVLISDKLEKGWQLYETDWEKNGIEYFMLLIPKANDEISQTSNILALNDMSATTAIMHPGGHGQQAIDPKGNFDSQAVFRHDHEKISWGVFYGTISEEAENIWHVEYRIFNGAGDLLDQKFYDKIKEATPVNYYYDATEIEGYDVYAYYHDAEFTQPWDPEDPNDLIPVTGTTIVYVQLLKYISQPWKTLVLPITIEDLVAYFGDDYQGVPSVNVQEFQEIDDNVLTVTPNEDFYRCKLLFHPVHAIEAYKPYLFKVNRVDESIINKIYAAEGTESCKITKIDDYDNPGISISMEGTLESDGFLMDASDGLHFYFGYDEAKDAYNFYRVSATIPRNRCWFYISDNRAAGAKLSFSFSIAPDGGEEPIGEDFGNQELTAVKGIENTVVKGDWYNLNGQKLNGRPTANGIYVVNGKKFIVK